MIHPRNHAEMAADMRVRDANMNVIGHGALQRCAALPVARVDIWPGLNGAGQMGVTGDDDSSGITTVLDCAAALAWARSNYPDATVVHHKETTP